MLQFDRDGLYLCSFLIETLLTFILSFFLQWKFAFLSLGRPEYLQDNDIVASRFQVPSFSLSLSLYIYIYIYIHTCVCVCVCVCACAFLCPLHKNNTSNHFSGCWVHFYHTFQRRDVYGAWEQYLGLEHTDNAPKRSYTANQVYNSFQCPFHSFYCF